MRAWVQIPLLTTKFFLPVASCRPTWQAFCTQTSTLASVAQQAARQSHNLKAVSSSLTGGRHFDNFIILNIWNAVPFIVKLLGDYLKFLIRWNPFLIFLLKYLCFSQKSRLFEIPRSPAQIFNFFGHFRLSQKSPFTRGSLCYIGESGPCRGHSGEEENF